MELRDKVRDIGIIRCLGKTIYCLSLHDHPFIPLISTMRCVERIFTYKQFNGQELDIFSKIEYKGYTYEPWDDFEEDNIKRSHDVYGPNGDRLSLPCSPYAAPGLSYLRLWVDAGCPYPPGQRVSEEELKEMVFTNITEEELD